MLDFSVIAERHSPSGLTKLEMRLCPDQYVGLVSKIEKTGDFTCRIPTSERPPSLACVLLILESPHTSEFDTSPGPAKGKTGTNIVRYLRDVPGIADKRDFGLLLVNAIQYQCSLGRPTSEVRDAVFTEAWSNGGRFDFETRLRALYRAVDCVVNCCTRGPRETASQLRVQVQRSLEVSLPSGTSVLRRNHPSFWHFSSNRSREWPYTASQVAPPK